MIFYGNEPDAQVIILDTDGETAFNGRRTIREITSDDAGKSGVVIVNSKKYDVELHADWKWYGSIND